MVGIQEGQTNVQVTLNQLADRDVCVIHECPKDYRTGKLQDGMGEQGSQQELLCS